MITKYQDGDGAPMTERPGRAERAGRDGGFRSCDAHQHVRDPADPIGEGRRADAPFRSQVTWAGPMSAAFETIEAAAGLLPIDAGVDPVRLGRRGASTR